MKEISTLENTLSKSTREGQLYRNIEEGKIQCFACGHLCKIQEGKVGVCRVRFNKNGKLYVPHGYVGALQCDPIEKKPFFHALPGNAALSFGMLGCDFHCSYCQNWMTSQVLRDPQATSTPERITASKLIQLAQKHNAKVIASTYNEPLITSEWAVCVFKEAKKFGLKTAYISNGNGTPEVLEYLKPWVDFYKVDLKSFNPKHYLELGGKLETILNTIQLLKQMNFWVEIVTLCIPGFNDSDQELKSMAQFLTSVSPNIPWHVTAFHQDYKMRDKNNTSVKTLLRAAKIGENAGLKFVYAGNLPGQVGNLENTYCPQCKILLIERYGFKVLKNHLQDGNCPNCKAKIPGVWS